MRAHEAFVTANRCQAAGQIVEAIACYREAATLDPGLAAAHVGLAAILFAQGRYVEAEVCCRNALRAEGASAAHHSNLAAVLTKLGRFGEAEASARRAIQCDPCNPGGHNNLGNALHEQGRLAEAEACFRSALEQLPGHAELRVSLANTLRERLCLEEAMGLYDEVLQGHPRHAAARMNRALIMLQTGQWDQGWEEYEARWQAGEMAERRFRQPLWDGAPLEGKRILLYAEQGLGDTIQFVRYAGLVKQLGGTVLLECQPRLARLLQTASFIDQVIPAGSTLPEFDIQAPLLSLPRILRATPDHIPGRDPYLRADAEREAFWRQRLSGETRLRVGLVWAGNPKQKNDSIRSLNPHLLAPLSGIPGLRLFSLQRGGPPPDFEIAILAPDLDFVETAAAIQNLDLVISVCTSVAHLTGAMGKPVWTLLRFAGDWRWLLARDDTPWYPTMRLFRQDRPGDWPGVIERVRTALRSLCPH